MGALPESAEALVEHSADPGAARRALDRLGRARPADLEHVAGDEGVAAAVVAVAAVGRWAADLVVADADAVRVLGRLDDDVDIASASDADDLVRRHGRELLRIAARDLLGHDDIAATTASLSRAATAVLGTALRLNEVDQMAVIGMGKLGAGELNYASDVDLLLVADEADVDERPLRAALDQVRRTVRVDLALRPEGRDGALVRTVDGYVAHWERWAAPWERQALVKARPVAGDERLGAAFATAAGAQVWDRGFGPEDIRSVRSLKVRAEEDVERRGAGELDVKRGSGGIRDVEFAVQLLQLVHGGADRSLRTPATLSALSELAVGGYVGTSDADALADAYSFLRVVEHRLQLVDLQPGHVLPTDAKALDRLARAAGLRSSPASSATEALLGRLREHRTAARAVHEHLWFRPLLESFSATGGPLSATAAMTRLAAFGFSDAQRTRQAVVELTRGLSRRSRLMHQLLPLLLDWLSATPDPDMGLLGLRTLLSPRPRAQALTDAFRDSPEIARRLCTLLGTSRMLGEALERNPDMVPALVVADELHPRDSSALTRAAAEAVGWRIDSEAQRLALKRFTDREGLRIGAADVLGGIDTPAVGPALSALAEAAVETAIAAVALDVPLAVIAMGRFGGSELSYASDLDLVFVAGDQSSAGVETAERAVAQLLRFLGKGTPHLYDIDAGLRPEGRQGALVRSLDAWRAYLDRWAEPWERLALVRARPVAGDEELGRQFIGEVVAPWVWERPVTDDERRTLRRVKARAEAQRHPTGDDPDFHLKLGRGGLADIEFTAQLLQLEHGIRDVGTAAALDELHRVRALDDEEHAVLIEAHALLERTRNRLFLVSGQPGDALPAQAERLERLATSLDTSAAELREAYRRVTRRARRVVDERFYGRG